MESKSAKDETFDSIYQAYRDSIYKAAVSDTKNGDWAEEVTQKAFYQLYTHYETVNSECIYAWLMTTVKNLIRNDSRSRKREIVWEISDSVEGMPGGFVTDDVEDFYFKQTQKRLAGDLDVKIFKRLYKEHRKWYHAIHLVYCRGKSQQEAAEELGIAVTVLNSRIYRAKQWIRKNYRKEYEEIVNWF